MKIMIMRIEMLRGEGIQGPSPRDDLRDFKIEALEFYGNLSLQNYLD